MNKETVFFTLFISWYLQKYGPPHNLILLLIQIYNYSNDFFQHFNSKIYPEYFKIKTTEDEDIIQDNSCQENRVEPKPKPKYEDKFLNEIRKLDKEFIFDEEEERLRSEKFVELHNSLKQSEYFDKIKEIKDKISEIEIKLTKYEASSDDDYCICEDDDNANESFGLTKDQKINNLLDIQKQLCEEENILNEQFETPEGSENFIKKIKLLAYNFVISKRMERLKNCYVIEQTPLGNVLMVYDTERESFKYYSDNNIPYRYLEVVGRKYIKQFGLRPIFVDMEEELKLSEEKWEKDKKEKDEEDKKKKEDAIKNIKPIEEKKNVYTKFKSYNKEAGTGHVNTAAPPKNSIQNTNTNINEKENEKILLKENANRYTYEGKFANFSFIKKVDRKIVDKKFAMTFSDFKKKILTN